MAYSSAGCSIYSWPSDIDRSNVALNQYTAVAIGPAQNVQGSGQGNCALVAYADGLHFIGILTNAPRQGNGGTVTMRGIERCRAGGTWNAGDALKVMTGGLLTKAGSGDTIFGYAGESAVPGDISTVVMP